MDKTEENKSKKNHHNMTDEEAKQHAVKVHAMMVSHPALNLLIDLSREEYKKGGHNQAAYAQFAYIAFDLMGVHYERFQSIKKNENK